MADHRWLRRFSLDRRWPTARITWQVSNYSLTLTRAIVLQSSVSAVWVFSAVCHRYCLCLLPYYSIGTWLASRSGTEFTKTERKFHCEYTETFCLLNAVSTARNGTEYATFFCLVLYVDIFTRETYAHTHTHTQFRIITLSVMISFSQCRASLSMYSHPRKIVGRAFCACVVMSFWCPSNPDK